MKSVLYPILAVFMFALFAVPIYGEPLDKNIMSRTAEVMACSCVT